MGIHNSYFVLTVLAIMLLGIVPARAGIGGDENCEGDVQTMLDKCGKYVSPVGPKINPSPDCCTAVQHANLTCACTHVLPKLKKVDMNKACFVAAKCGNPLTPGIQCGSYKVPLSC